MRNPVFFLTFPTERACLLTSNHIKLPELHRGKKEKGKEGEGIRSRGGGREEAESTVEKAGPAAGFPLWSLSLHPHSGATLDTNHSHTCYGNNQG